MYKNVLKNSKYLDKTIILISHHLDVLSHIDKVIFIHNNNVYFDTPQKLFNENTDYRQFLNQQ